MSLQIAYNAQDAKSKLSKKKKHCLQSYIKRSSLNVFLFGILNISYNNILKFYFKNSKDCLDLKIT